MLKLLVASLLFAQCLAVQRLAQTNDDFTLKLLEQIEQKVPKTENIFVSPFSLNTVLSMLMVGSAGITYDEIFKALGHSNESNLDILNAFQKVNTELNSKLSGSNTVLNTANSIAVQKDAQLLQSFVNNITQYFSSQVLVEDFSAEAQKSTDNINAWVKEKTNEKIPKLFENTLRSDTILVLLNALYFKGNWKYQFAKNKTYDGVFNLPSKQIKEIKMMSTKEYLNFTQFRDGKLVELPYENQTLSMYIFLPKENPENSTLTSQFNKINLDERISQLINRSVILQMPKFKIEASYSLNEILLNMGIRQVFASTSDLSKINGKHNLMVSSVIQKTFIEVNEEGSEAAAATGAVVFKKAAIGRKIILDRPFMFFIRDNQHNMTLFAGIINDPK